MLKLIVPASTNLVYTSTERVIESVHCNKLSVEFKLNLEKM